MLCCKNVIARPNDYLYDPLFVVSGPKDHYKAAMVAKMSTAKFAICPVFPSMFSDLPNHPRQQLVMRTSTTIAPYSANENCQRLQDVKPLNIEGADRFSPILNIPAVVPTLILHPTPRKPSVCCVKRKRNRKIQTQYRESSAQTSPWEPPYEVMDGSDPEILMLDFLKWGSGLPAGVHEVQLIERARMKREWEKRLPPITDNASLEKRRSMIEAMERDEWAFRDQEIQDIQDLRMELLEKMLNELHEKSKCRTEAKMKMFYDMKQAEKNEKLAKLRHNTERALRKLEWKHRGIRTKYHPVNIVEEHADRKSELYGPVMRHGEHPKRWHQVIDEKLKNYRAQFIGVENFSTLPRWLDEATQIKDCCCIKLSGTRLCMRETNWTTPVLKLLHEELKNLHKTTRRSCTLRTRVIPPESPPPTPEVEGIAEWDESVHQASVLIESILRGRASQMLIFEGRDRCRELIKELRSTHALQEEERLKKFEERLEVMSQQRGEAVCLRNGHKLLEALNRLQGTTIGTLLDFLNKELRRLLDERKAHALCLMAERERHLREAAEAGRRQTEMRRRLEHDEMFKQVVKVDQDTVDLYLQDIVAEGMDFASSLESEEYVKKVAEKIDDDAYETIDNMTYREEEELVAELIHQFVLPEVEKTLIRERIKKRQKNHLKVAHEAIYRRMEHLPRRPPLLSILPSRVSITKIEEAEPETESFSYDFDRPIVDSVKQIAPEEVERMTGHLLEIDESELKNSNLRVLLSPSHVPDEDVDAASCVLSVMESLKYKKTDSHIDNILIRVGSAGTKESIGGIKSLEKEDDFSMLIQEDWQISNIVESTKSDPLIVEETNLNLLKDIEKDTSEKIEILTE